MEDLNNLKKYFLEKEQESTKLKEEIEKLKQKVYGNENNSNLTYENNKNISEFSISKVKQESPTNLFPSKKYRGSEINASSNNSSFNSPCFNLQNLQNLPNLANSKEEMNPEIDFINFNLSYSYNPNKNQSQHSHLTQDEITSHLFNNKNNDSDISKNIINANLEENHNNYLSSYTVSTKHKYDKYRNSLKLITKVLF